MKLILLVAILGMLSCKNEKLDDTKKFFYYEDGKVQAIKYFKDSLLSGECFWFHRNGKLKQKTTYIEGLANGYSYTFYESGALQSIRIFRDDKIAGYSVNYYDKSVDFKKSIYFFNDSGRAYFKREFDTVGNVTNEEGRLPN